MPVTTRVASLTALGLLLAGVRAGAQTWQVVDVPAETGHVTCFAESASGVRLMGGDADFGIVSRTWGGIFRSTGTSDWERIVPHVPVAGFAIVPATSAYRLFTAYAATGDGVFTSNDGGLSWRTAPELPGSATSTSVALAAGGVLVVGTSLGAVWSDSTPEPIWTASSGMEGFAAQALAVEPDRPSRVYATAVSTSDSSRGGVFVSDDSGRSWTRLDPTGFSLPTTAIAVDPTNPRILYAVAASGVFRSDDGGDSWLPRGERDLPPNAVRSVVIHPDNPLVLFASTSSGAGVYRSLDRGDSWAPYNTAFPSVPDFDVTALAFAPAHEGSAPILQSATYPSGVYTTEAPDEACHPSATSLCLGRFRLSVDWQASPSGPSQSAEAVGVTSDSGYLWFFDAANVELMVKILDGRDVNGSFWVFYGALSNVAYTLTVEDMLTGAERTYSNPWGELSSVADTHAFPTAGAAVSAPLPPPTAQLSPLAGTTDSCSTGPFALCLEGGRFRVDVAWQLSPSGPSSLGRAVPLTDDTGYFWFFGGANVELVVKVLDGRPENGHFWVFYGALSNLEYTITVRDTATGQIRTYHNAPGEQASVADTTAF